MVETLFKFPARTRMVITFDWPEEKKLAELRREGFLKIYLHGRVLSLDHLEEAPAKKNGLEVVVDELNLDPEDRERLVDSLETGLKRGKDEFESGWKAGPFIFSLNSWNAASAELFMKSLIQIFYLLTVHKELARFAMVLATWQSLMKTKSFRTNINLWKKGPSNPGPSHPPGDCRENC